MAENEQSPPKGKAVDVFDVLHDIAQQGPEIDPTPAMRHIQSLSKKGLNVTLDEQAIRQKYAQHDSYKDDVDGSKLTTDIRSAKTIYDELISGAHEPVVRTKPVGALASPSTTSQWKDRLNKYNFNYGGVEEPWAPPEQMATSRAKYVDASGQARPLSDLDRANRNLYVDYELETDEHGKIQSAPVYKEVPYGADPNRLDIASSWGDQPKERTWLGGGWTGFYNSLMQIPSYVDAVHQSTWGDESTNRLRTLAHMHNQYDAPSFAGKWDEIYNRGGMSPNSNYGESWLSTSDVNEEKAYELYKGLKKDERRIRALAKEGDTRSKLDANIIDLGDGLYGKSALERIMDSAHMTQKTAGLRSSERSEKLGAFGSMEGFTQALGSTTAFMLPQTGAARGLAGFATLLGEAGLAKGLVTEGLERGAGMMLTKAGQRAVGISSATVPSMQMSAMQYDAARQAGYGHEDGLTLAAMAAPAILLTEGLISSPWMIKSYMANGGAQAYEKMLVKELGKGGAKSVERKGFDALRAKSVEMWAATTKWLKEGSDIAWANRAKNTLEAGLRESVQEGMEEGIYSAQEDILDWWTNKNRFQEQRGAQYSFWNRVGESAALGGLAGGLIGSFGSARRPKQPNDPDVYAAVADGNSKAVLTTAENLFAKGQITNEDLSVIKQDVQRAQEAVKGLDVVPSQLRSMIAQDGSLMSEYAKAVAARNEVDGRLAQLRDQSTSGTASPELQEQIKALESERTTHQATIDSVVNGAALVSKLKADAVQKHLVTSGGTMIAEPLVAIDRFVQGAMAHAENEDRMAADLSSKRGPMVQGFSAAVDKLIDAKGKKATEALVEVDAIRSQMREQGVLSKEDMRRMRSALQAKRADLMRELAEIPVEKAPDDSPNQTLGARAQAWLEGMDYEDGSFQDWLADESVAGDLLSGELGEDAKQVYDATKKVDLSLSSIDESAEDALPAQSSFETRERAAVIADYINSTASGMSADRVLQNVRKRTSSSEQEVASLADTIKQLEEKKTVGEWARGPLHSMAISTLTQAGANRPVGMQQLAKENEQVYAPAAAMTADQRAQAENTLSELKKEHARLGQLVDLRRQQLANFQRNDIGIRRRLVEFFIGFDNEFMKNPAVAERMADMERAIAGNDQQAQFNALLQLEQIVHERLRDTKGSARKFVRHVYDSYGAGDPRNNSLASYLNPRFSEDTPFEAYHTPDVFDFSWENSQDKAMIGAIITHTTNWMSRLGRVSPVDAYNAYRETVVALKPDMVLPNAEQRERIIDLVANIVSPDEELTNELLNALLNNRDDQERSGVDRSIILLGHPGTGKTTTVPFAVSVASKLLGEPVNTVVIAPGKTNTMNLSQAVTKTGDAAVRAYALAEMEKVHLSGPARLFLVDECHAVGQKDLERFKSMAKVMPDASFIFMGDENQSSALSSRPDEVMPLKRGNLRTMPLSVSFRHGNVEIMALFDDLRQQVFRNLLRNQVVPILAETQYSSASLQGVTLLDTNEPSVLYDRFVDDLIANEGKLSGLLLTLDAKQRDEAINHIRTVLDNRRRSDINEQLEHMVRHMDQGEGSALGLEAACAYIAFGPERLSQAYTRYLYTAVSRAKSCVVAMFPGGKSIETKNIRSTGGLDSNTLKAMYLRESQTIKAAVEVLGPRDIKEPERRPTVSPDGPKQSPLEVPSPNKIVEQVSAEQARLEAERDAERSRNESLNIPEIKDGRPPVSAGVVYMSNAIAEVHKSSGGVVEGVHTGAMDFIQDVDAESVANPKWKFRMELLKDITRMEGFKVDLVAVKDWHVQSAADKAGAKVASGVQVHVANSDSNLDMMIAAGKRIGMSVLDYDAARAEGLTLLGGLPTQVKWRTDHEAFNARLVADVVSGIQPERFKNVPLHGVPYLRGSLEMVKEGDNEVSFYQYQDNLGRRGFKAGRPKLVRDEKHGFAIVSEPLPFGSQNIVLLSSRPVTEGDWKDINSEMQQLRRDPDMSFEKIENSLGYQTVMANSANLIGDIGQKEQGPLDDHWVERNALLEFASKDKGKRLTAVSVALKELMAAQKNGSTVRIGVRTVREGHDRFVLESDYSHLTSGRVRNVSPPALLMNLTGRLNRSQAPVSAGPRAVLPSAASRRPKAKEGSASVSMRTQSMEKVRQYYRRVFGGRFVDRQLEFAPKITDIDGRELFGVMEGARISLEAVDGRVRLGVPQHEAAHYVIDHVLDSDSRREILNEARQRIALRDDMQWWQITDERAHEYIADQYERQDFDASTLLGRFLRWLKNVMERWGVYRLTIEDLLENIERGEYRDAPVVMRDQVARYSMKPTDAVVPPADRLERTRYEDSPRDAHFLERLFGGSGPVEDLRTRMAHEIIRYSPYQAPVSGDLYTPLPSLRSAITSLRNAYVRDAESIERTTIRIGEDEFPIDAVPYERVPDIDDQQIGDYWLHHLSRPAVFDGLVKTLFPNVDIERFQEGEQTPDGEEADIDMDAVDLAVDRMHDINDRTRAFDRQSALTTLLTAHMPVLRYDEVIGAPIEHDASDTVDMNLLQEVISQVSQGAMFEGDPVDVLEKRVAEMMTSFRNSRHGDVARTFYHRFLKSTADEFVDSNGLRTRSYRSIVVNAQKLLANAKDEAAMRAAVGRVDMARRVTNNVVRVFLESVRSNKAKGRYRSVDAEVDSETDRMTFPVGRLSMELFDNTTSEDVIQDIKDRTNSMFMASGASGIKVSPAVRNRFHVGNPQDPAPAEISIFQDTVRFDKDVLVRITSQGSQDKYELVTKEPELIQRFFSSAGFPLMAGTIEWFLSPQTSEYAARRAALLPTIIGQWAAAIHAGIHSAEGTYDPNLWSNKRLARLNRTIGGLGESTQAEVYGDRTATGDRLVRISDLFGVNQVLAEIESKHRASNGGRKFRNPSGETEQDVVKGSLLTRMLGGAYAATDHASDSFVNIAEDLVRRDPGLRRGAAILNPFVDGTDAFKLKRTYMGKGLLREDVGFGSDFRSLTTADTEQMNLQLFMSQLLTQRQQQRIFTPAQVHGSRNVNVIYETELVGGQFVSVQRGEKGGVSSVSINYAQVDRLFLKAQDYYRRQKEVSLLRWTRALGREGAGMEEVMALIPTMPKELAMASLELVNNADYVVQKDGSLLPGNALTFQSKLFGNGARKGLDRSNVRESIARLMKPHVDAYKDAIERLGVTSFDPSINNATTKQHRDTMIEAYVYMTTLVDHFVGTAIQGPVTQFKSFEDWVKRRVLALSPGHIGIHDDYKASIAVIQEPGAQPYASVQDGKGADAWDGQAFYTPWGFARMSIAYGGPEGVMGETVNKPVYVANDMSDKNSTAYMSPTIYRQNSWLRELVGRSLVVEGNGMEQGVPFTALRDLWYQTLGDINAPYDRFAESFRSAVNAVSEAAHQLKVDLPVSLTSTSNVKYGLRGVNQGVTELPLTTVPIDLRNYGIQTNLERSLNDLNAPFNTQLSALMGVSAHNSERVARMRALEVENMDRWIERLERDINMASDGTPQEKAREYLRQVGLRYTVAQGEIGQLPDTLADPNASMNDPIVKAKLLQYMATRLRTEGINPRMHGQQFTEVSAHGFEVLDVQDTQRPANENAPVPEADGVPISDPSQYLGVRNLADLFDRVLGNDPQNFADPEGSSFDLNEEIIGKAEELGGPRLVRAAKSYATGAEGNVPYLLESLSDKIFDRDDLTEEQQDKLHAEAVRLLKSGTIREQAKFLAANDPAYKTSYDAFTKASNAAHKKQLDIAKSQTDLFESSLGQDGQQQSGRDTSGDQPAGLGQLAGDAGTAAQGSGAKEGGTSATPTGEEAGQAAAGTVVGRPLRAPSREGEYQPGECLMPFLYAEQFGVTREVLNSGIEQIKSDILARLGSDALALFEDSLNVYVSRTPLSSVSGGHMFKVVGFVNDAGNTIIVPPDFHRLTDGDFDGDQLTVICRNIRTDKEGIPSLADDPMGAMQNQMLEVINDFYRDPKNSEAIFTPTSVRRMREAMHELIEEDVKAGTGLYGVDELSQEFNTPFAAMTARRRVFDGDQLIGILASALKGYAFLRQARNAVEGDQEKLKTTFLSWDAPEMGGDAPVAEIMSGFMQAALDNVKDPILGPAGINADNVNVVIGAVLSGVPLKESLAIAKHPIVMDATAYQDRQRTAIREGAPAARKDFFSALRDSKVPDQSEVDAEGKPIEGPRLARKSELVRYAMLAEAVRRTTELFNLKVGGIPVDKEGLIKFRHDTESWLGATWSDVAQGRPSDPDYFMRRNPVQKDMQQYRADERALRQFFDPRAVIDALGQFKAYITAADRVAVKLYEDAFFDHQPAMMKLHDNMVNAMGRNGYFSGDGEKAYTNALNTLMIGAYTNIAYGGQPLTLDPKLGEIDLSTPGGQWRFVAEFPDYWQNMVNTFRQELKDNLFVSESRYVIGEVPMIEMIDNRRLQDPVIRARVRRSIASLNWLGDAMEWAMPPSQYLTLYSMLKDKFSFRKGSLMPFLPPGALNNYASFLDQLSDIDPATWSDMRLPFNGDSAGRTLGDLMSVFDEALPVKYSELVPRGIVPDEGSDKPPHATAMWFKTMRSIGYQKVPEVRNAADPGVVYTSPWSRVAVPFALSGEPLHENGQVLGRLDIATHQRVRAGEPNIKMTFTRSSGLRRGALYLPSGDVAQVKSVSEDGKQVVLDASMNQRIASALEAEVTDTLHEMMPVTNPYPKGLGSMDLKKALDLVAAHNPNLQGWAAFLSDQQSVLARNSVVTFSVDPEDTLHHKGHIDPEGNITINANNQPAVMEHAIMHEAVHRFTLHAMDLDPSLLQAHDLKFRGEVERLYEEVKRLMPDSQLYGMRDASEFIAEAVSSGHFQQQLLAIETPPNKPNLWQRIVNAIRRLFNGHMGDTTVRNGYLARILDLTEGYIRTSSYLGNGFNESKYDLRMGANLEQPIGSLPKFGPIKDINDIADRLQSDPSIGRSMSTMSREQQMIYHLSRMDAEKGVYFVGDRSFNIAGMDKLALRRLVLDEIIPFAQSYDDRKADRIVEILNGPKEDIVATWRKSFKHMDGTPMDKDDAIEKFVDQIDDDNGDGLFIRYSDLTNGEKVINWKGEQKRIKDLGLKHVNGFAGNNPIIRLSEGEHGMVATVFAWTHTPLSVSSTKGPTWLSNFIKGNTGSLSKGLSTPNDEGGIRKIMLTMQAMALSQANPQLKFRRIKVVSMNSTGFSHDGVWMYDQLQEIKVMRNVPALYNEIPASIRSVLDDDQLYDGDRYGQSFVHQYHDWLSEKDHVFSNESDEDVEAWTQRWHLLTEMQRYERGDQGSIASLKQAYTWRQRHMYNQVSDKSKLLTNPEWLHIAQGLIELESVGRRGNNTLRDMGDMSKFLKSGAAVGNDLFQHLYRATMNTRSLVASEVMKLTEVDQRRIADMESVRWQFSPHRGVSKLVDSGWKRFERLYRYSTEAEGGHRIVDASGKRVRARLNEIHWNVNDKETARLLASGDLSHKELEFANYVLDRIHDLMIEDVVHTFKQEGKYMNENGKFRDTAAKEDAVRLVNSTWKRGWLPVMRRPSSEAAYDSNFKNVWGSMVRESANVDELFALDPERGMPAEDGRIANRYMKEFWDTASRTEHGSRTRLTRLGLYNDGEGNTILQDPVANEQITENLEIVLAYFTMAVKRKHLHEDRTLPVYHSVKALMATMQDHQGKSQKNALAYMEDFSRRLIRGEGALANEINKMGPFNVTPIVNTGVALTTYSGMFFNPYVGIASGLMNTVSTLGTSLTNYTAANGLFGTGDWMKAVGMFVSPDQKQHKKAMALMPHHFVYERGEQDTINSQLYSRTRRQVTSGHGVNFLNRFTDRETRALVMTAQMIKDGSWEAYDLVDGKVTYDVKKDDRFYDKEGKLKPDASLIMNAIKERLIEQAVVPQSEDQPLQAGYDLEMGRTFKWLSDKYIIGGMDSDQRTMADSYLIGRVLMQFRRYMPSKLDNWFGSRKSIDSGGSWKIESRNGEKMAVWEKREVESTMGAMINLFHTIRDSKDLSWKEVANMSEADRTALIRGAYDLTAFLALLILYTGLKAPDDDELKSKEFMVGRTSLRDTRMKRILENTAWDQLSGSPAGLVKMLGEPRGWAPSVGTAWKMMNLVSDPSKVTRILPGHQAVDMVESMMETDEPQEVAGR